MLNYSHDCQNMFTFMQQNNNFEALPNDYKIHKKKYRSIADFLSGMTDRFANEIHKSLN